MASQLHFGPGDSATFGTTGNGTSQTASFDKSLLYNVQIGDLLVAWIHNQASTTGGIITPPTGWVRYGAAAGTSTWAISRTSGFYYYPIRSQDDIDALPATVTWSISSVGGREGCVVSRATGIDLNNIEDSASAAFQGGSGTNLTITGITTVAANTLLVGGLHHQNSASTVSPDTTAFLTEFQEYKTSPTGSTLANTGSAMGYKELTSAGATGNVVATFNGSTTANGGEIVAFKAGNWTPPAITRPTAIGISTTFKTPNAVTSFTITRPGGLQDGDALVMAVSAQTPTATTDFACSGWTRISKPFVGSSTTYRLMAFYAMPVPVASAVTDTSFTFVATDSVSGGRVVAEMFVVRGAELSNLTSGISPYGVPSSQTVSVLPDAPLVDNNLLLVAYGAQFTNGIDYSVAAGPAGMTQRTSLVSSTTATSKTTLAVYRQDIESGSVGSKSLTWSGVQSQTTGVAVSIRGAGRQDPNLGADIQFTSAPDTLASGHLFYASATDTLATPAEVRAVPTGYPSVSAMLATTPFYIAHRGSSDDWPEMSLYAYTQSVFWGAQALEVSMNRTIDGVWVGIHDQTLDRTSGTTGFDITQHTWAEVQAYQISPAGTVDGSQPARPYMRFEEILAAYYGTHVIFVDPKNSATFANELLDMMDAMPGNPRDHFVAKYYAVTTNWVTMASGRGYKTWGYFYQADAANFAAYQGRWDILGLDYTADQATWNAILAYGKPVIGHTIPNATAANTALNFGASGLMVSGVQQVIPRSPS